MLCFVQSLEHALCLLNCINLSETMYLPLAQFRQQQFLFCLMLCFQLLVNGQHIMDVIAEFAVFPQL